MWKWSLVLGLVAAGYLLYQLNQGELLLTDTFRMVQTPAAVTEPESIDRAGNEPEKIKRSDRNYYKTLTRNSGFFENKFKAVADKKEFDSQIMGAVLWPSLEFSYELAGFFERLSKSREVKTFVILGENHKWSGKYEIAFPEFGYDTAFGELTLDNALAERFLSNPDIGGGISFWALNREQSVDVLLPFIKRSFPDSKVVTVAVKDSAQKNRLTALATSLAQLPEEDVFVIAATAFSQNLDPLVADFHFELTQSVFENFEIDGFEQMDADSRQVVFTLMKYLDVKKAKKAEVEGRQVIIFSKGEPDIEDRDLTIMAFGDLMLGRYVRTLMDEAGDKNYVFAKIEGYEGRFFEGADIVHGNLEGPIKGQGKKGGTAMSFAFNEDVAPFLKEKGFNLVSIANNHALDQGWDGRDSTISALNKAGLSWCGHPSEADPLSVYYKWVGKKKVAFLCFQDVTHKLDDKAAVDLIRKVRDEVDYLIISIHWGIEYKRRSDYSTQIEPGRAFIDAGADFVIGHHPHVVQNFEIYNGKFIFYSLGNFVFDQYWAQMTQEELAIGIVLDDDDNGEGLRTKVYLFPMKSERSQSRLMTQEERSAFIEDFLLYGEYTEGMKTQIRSGVIEF